MRILLKKRKYSLVWALLLACLLGTSQTMAKDRYEVFKDKVPAGARISVPDAVREGGGSEKSTHYIYVQPSETPTRISGLSIPIRENPGPGQYRYITFAWIKWGGEEIGMQLGVKNVKGNALGKKYNYTYMAGPGKELSGLKVDKKVTGGWMVVTRDLWKDFGEFTLTDVSFLCPTRRDAGFDNIILGATQDAFADVAPKILPGKVAAAETVNDAAADSISLDTPVEEEEAEQQVQIDWAAQIKAGGFIMYPLYLLGILALVITIQRFFTSTRGRLAPKNLAEKVNECIARKDYDGAVDLCKKSSSTLGNSLGFIVEHRDADWETVCQTAGDMAARDIRSHLSRIYPLTVISSLSPLLGLFGTIVGMIEAFGLVALFGDEGGASILSDSISKALITTPAGLVVAMPSIAVYFILKSRISNLGSQIEMGIESVVNSIYLNKKTE
jgi:biopolymer transport protein ExbB/TolQ